MAIELLQTLIDKQDTFEIVRDQIGAILVAELVNQRTLAVAASKDPLDWTMSIYVERQQPLEQWLDSGVSQAAPQRPVVSIWLDNMNLDTSVSSKSAAKQVYEATFNVDIYAQGFTSDNPAGGHVAADFAARTGCHAAVRLVRNILAAPQNRYLQLRGLVWAHPSFENFEFREPAIDDPLQGMSIWAGRGRFNVKFNESAPEFTGDTIEAIEVTVSDDGLLFVQEIS